MKKNKALELVNNVQTFGDAWDVTDTIFKSQTAGKENANYTANTFEFVFKPGEVIVSAVEAKRVVKKNKEVDYPRKTLAKVSAPTAAEAFKEAALKAFS